MKKCTKRGCRRPYLAKGLCRYHYYRSPAYVARRKELRENPDTPKWGERSKGCSVAGCTATHCARGLCSKHYQLRPEIKKYRQSYHAKPKHKEALKAYRASARGKSWRHNWSRTAKALFYRGKISAKQYSRSWEITLEEFIFLRQGLCRYCGFSLPEAGYGLDRIDNAKGYTLDNVVPCCTACNAARNDNFTHEEMLNEIGPVLRKVKLARVAPVASVPYTPDVSSSPEAPTNADH